LICRFIKAGLAEETVLVMYRQTLLNTVAEIKINPVAATAEFIKPTAIWEQELELRRVELMAKEEKQKTELEFRAAKVIRHEEMRAAEEMRWKTEMQFREDEVRRQQEFRLAELNYRQMN